MQRRNVKISKIVSVEMYSRISWEQQQPWTVKAAGGPLQKQASKENLLDAHGTQLIEDTRIITMGETSSSS